MSTHPKKTESSAISENAARDFVKPERARVNVQLAVRASERERLKGLAAEHGLTLNAYVSRCAQTPGRLATLPPERGEREARAPRREGGQGYEKSARAGRTMSVRLDADVYEVARAEAERERMSLSRWLRARALAGPAGPAGFGFASGFASAHPHPLAHHLDSPDAIAAAVGLLPTTVELHA